MGDIKIEQKGMMEHVDKVIIGAIQRLKSIGVDRPAPADVVELLANDFSACLSSIVQATNVKKEDMLQLYEDYFDSSMEINQSYYQKTSEMLKSVIGCTQCDFGTGVPCDKHRSSATEGNYFFNNLENVIGAR